MFTRLAKSGLAKFRRVQPRRIAPGRHEAGLSNRTYCNDNLPGFRRPAVVGRRRSPIPALTCHWFDRDGRLECRWQVETNDDAPISHRQQWTRKGVHMAHRFQRKQLATPVLAFVPVTFLFWLAVLAATYRI
jgi:hypothetical protein